MEYIDHNDFPYEFRFSGKEVKLLKKKIVPWLDKNNIKYTTEYIYYTSGELHSLCLHDKADAMQVKLVWG